MLLRLQNRTICRLYQDFPPPASIAKSDAAPTSEKRRVFKLIMDDLHIEELTAPRSYNPFGGESKFTSEMRQFQQEKRSLVWATTLAVIATVSFATLLGSGYSLPPWWILAALAVVAGLAERHGVALFGDRERGIEIAVSFVPFVFAAVAFGPLAALVVGALGQLADFRAPYLRWAVYTSARALTGAAAGLAAAAIYGSSTTFFAIVLAVFAAALAYLVVDVMANMATLAVRGSASPFSYPRTTVPLFLLAIPLYVPAVAFLVWGYEQYSFAVVGTFFIPVLALQRVAHLYQEQREAARGLASAYERLEQAHLSFAAALVATLDARDQYTAGHSTAVAVYSRDIARQMGLSEIDQQTAHLSGLVHDIGKIGLPPGLLEKPGPLTLDERRIMQTHSEIGERILANVEDYGHIAKIVRHHHERIDGNGYPSGLVGEEIQPISRIIAVADAYNAMTSDRPYREAMPSQVARMRLAQAVGAQFDIAVVAAFEAILATADEQYRQGTRRDFDFSESSAGFDPPTAIAADVA
jgi:putative nucleotidyltransferase with HDIG domain